MLRPNHFCKAVLLYVFWGLLPLLSSAQYADLGQGTLKNYIWWVNWYGINIVDGATNSFTTTDGLEVEVTVSNTQTPPKPFVMNTWHGAVFHNLYNFTDPLIMPALLTELTDRVITRFTLTFSATRNGSPANFNLVAADAEASSDSEPITLTTTGSNWTTYEFFRNSSQTVNPVTGCGTKSVIIKDTWPLNTTNIGQSPLLVTQADGTVTVDVVLDGTVYGASAVAFGILSPIDRGDLPASFGYANHRVNFSAQNTCNFIPPLPSVRAISQLQLGSVAGDADAVENSNDNGEGADEEGVSDFPEYSGNGNYSVEVVVGNTSGGSATLSAWFDFNGDNQFSTSERVQAVVPANTTSRETISWSDLGNFLQPGEEKEFAFRFRVSSDEATVQQPQGSSPDGEVEDYLVTITYPDQPQPPQISLNIPESICNGLAVNIENNTQDGNSFEWTFCTAGVNCDQVNIASFTGHDPPAITYSAPGRYEITLVVNKGTATEVTAKRTIIIEEAPEIELGEDVAICPGESVQLGGSLPDGATYRWSTGSETKTISATTSGSYTLEMQLANGCVSTDAINITAASSPALVISKSNDVDCSTTTSILTVTGASSYIWNNTETLNNPNAASPTASPAQTTTYVVTGTNADGCTTTDSITVFAAFVGDGKFYIPNAFTPNGDGANDCFGVPNPPRFNEFNFFIYNRWGQKVFETGNSDRCWDGTFQGRPQEGGAYIYVMKGKSDCGNIEKKGTILLIR